MRRLIAATLAALLLAGCYAPGVVTGPAVSAPVPTFDHRPYCGDAVAPGNAGDQMHTPPPNCFAGPDPT
jgi:hypothetical protein